MRARLAAAGGNPTLFGRHREGLIVSDLGAEVHAGLDRRQRAQVLQDLDTGENIFNIHADIEEY